MNRAFILAVPLALGLTYCTATERAWAENYWVQSARPLPVAAVYRVPNVYAYCGSARTIYGCTVRGEWSAVIYLDANAPDLDCVESHERKHAAGFDHHDRPANQVVC